VFVCVFAFLRARVYSFFAHRFVPSSIFFFIFIINDNNNAARNERAFSFRRRPKKREALKACTLVVEKF